MAGLGKNLRQHLRKLACKTPVDQLVKRGVKEVKGLGMDHIVSLVEEAVHRTLRTRLMGLEREQLAGATREEFLRLLESHQSLQKTHDEVVKQKQEAETAVDDLRRELSARQKDLDEKLAEAEFGMLAQHEGENALIVAQIDALFGAVAVEGADTDPELRNRVLEMVMEIVGKERKVALQAKEAAHDREVDNLQRRITKLSASLKDTENQLAHIASVKQIDPGISSIYREVQGLQNNDERFERKKELMSDIFAANLDLQKKGVG